LAKSQEIRQPEGRPSSGEKKHVPRYKAWLEEDQVARLLDTIRRSEPTGVRDWSIAMLCRWSLRIGEIVGRKALRGLYVEDVSFETSSVRVRSKGL
jgi:site-specific recombinase XerC